MPDQFGIPDNMFGPMPEDFYSAIGRVVLVAALLDLRIGDLLNTLDRVPQTAHAGTHGDQPIKSVLKLLETQEPTLRETGAAVLTEVGDAMEQRNAVVHNVWTAPSTDSAYGWRPVRKNKRQEPTQPHVGTTMSLANLREFVDQLVRLISQVDDLRQRVDVAR